MSLVNAIGAPIVHSISNRQLGTTDLYPGVVVDIVPGENPRNGLPSPVATIITERTYLAGDTYLDQQDVPSRFIYPRYTRVESLDGTAAKPKQLEDLVREFVEARLTFIAERAKSQSIAALDAEVDADASA
jgi:hypothetical protein